MFESLLTMAIFRAIIFFFHCHHPYCLFTTNSAVYHLTPLSQRPATLLQPHFNAATITIPPPLLQFHHNHFHPTYLTTTTIIPLPSPLQSFHLFHHHDDSTSFITVIPTPFPPPPFHHHHHFTTTITTIVSSPLPPPQDLPAWLQCAQAVLHWRMQECPSLRWSQALLWASSPGNQPRLPTHPNEL